MTVHLYNRYLQNEALVSSLKQELSGSQQSSIKSEASNQQLRTEVELLKTSCRRAQLEADTAKKDCNLQLQMLSNLQDIQVFIVAVTAESANNFIIGSDTQSFHQ